MQVPSDLYVSNGTVRLYGPRQLEHTLHASAHGLSRILGPHFAQESRLTSTALFDFINRQRRDVRRRCRLTCLDINIPDIAEARCAVNANTPSNSVTSYSPTVDPSIVSVR
jgi:hypothetical protein